MKHWGVVITLLYALVVIGFLLPLGYYLADDGDFFAALIAAVDPAEGDPVWILWVVVALFITAQAALLFVSVDVSKKRLKPRRHIAIAVATTAFAVAVLTLAILTSVIVLLSRDAIFDWEWFWLTVPAGLWIVWAIVFFLYRERLSAQMNRTVGWLLNGSVLQLLVAVPTHIVVRQRDDCCAPLISGYGIATGIALMLMAFGPSVLFLYQDRARQRERRAGLPLLAKFPVRTLLVTIVVVGIVLIAVLSRDPRSPADAAAATVPAAANP
jgi:hypothetical protein